MKIFLFFPMLRIFLYFVRKQFKETIVYSFLISISITTSPYLSDKFHSFVFIRNKKKFISFIVIL